jgi:hypothetical protein
MIFPCRAGETFPKTGAGLLTVMGALLPHDASPNSPVRDAIVAHTPAVAAVIPPVTTMPSNTTLRLHARRSWKRWLPNRCSRSLLVHDARSREVFKVRLTEHRQGLPSPLASLRFPVRMV